MRLRTGPVSRHGRASPVAIRPKRLRNEGPSTALVLQARASPAGLITHAAQLTRCGQARPRRTRPGPPRRVLLVLSPRSAVLEQSRSVTFERKAEAELRSLVAVWPDGRAVLTRKPVSATASRMRPER